MFSGWDHIIWHIEAKHRLMFLGIPWDGNKKSFSLQRMMLCVVWLPTLIVRGYFAYKRYIHVANFAAGTVICRELDRAWVA